MNNQEGKITIHRKEATKTTLQNIYDVANKIAKNLQKRGIDVSDCFFTKEEWEAAKKNKDFKFI